MLRICFYKWVEYHINKINKRSSLINATIFRYKQLFRKVRKAIALNKKQDHQTLLQLKVFKAFKLQIQERQNQMESIRKMQLSRLFEKFKQAKLERVKEREVEHAIMDCYHQKLLMKGFVKLKKAARIMKKRNSNSAILVKKKKQLYFDKWVLRLQDNKLHVQLLEDSSLYYKEFLQKKVFKAWKQFIRDQKQYYAELESLRKVFGSWKKHTVRANEKRQLKFQPIHNTWRKITFFRFWKAATLDGQREKLALDFYRFKLFKTWKNYVDNIKQIELSLQDQEVKLTLQHMKYQKQRYFFQWFNKYEQKVQKDGLIKVLLSTKLKQNKLSLLKFGYTSLKNNWRVNKFIQGKKYKLLQMIIFQMKYFTDLTKAKLNQLQIYEETMKQEICRKIFNAFKSCYLITKEKQERSKQFYEKRLLKDCFNLFLSSIIIEYQRKKKLSEKFYYHRKLIYTFSAIRKHTHDRQQRRINQKRVEKFLGLKKFKFMKSVFKHFKGFLLSQSRGKKKLLQLEYNVFYQWRLLTKLSVIRRK